MPKPSTKFSSLSDDLILKILSYLDDDPRHYAILTCVSKNLSYLISTVCFKSKCLKSIPSVSSDLLPSTSPSSLFKLSVCCPGLLNSGIQIPDNFTSISDMSPHLACSGTWSFSREQGNKLLASRFKGDCLYVSDWPGCVHNEEKRSYMLFRGVFKDFKMSRVWRCISDVEYGSSSSSSSEGNVVGGLRGCVYCESRRVWDLHSMFCLRRGFGYHEDGDQVVRAYVCEYGHVSGAWTDSSFYN